MTNAELDRARAEEAAKRIKNLGTYGGSLPVYSISAITEAARLAREGWTPPVAVDPDIAEAKELALDWMEDALSFEDLALAGIKRGRELEKAVMENPIPEQNQEVKPSIDPDEAEADKMWEEWGHRGGVYLSLMAIKRGRALAAAEAKPGMVWVKHDGSAKSPVALGTLVAVKFVPGAKMPFKVGPAEYRDWQDITHYAIITPPEDVA